jgi:hypothetical protein
MALEKAGSEPIIEITVGGGTDLSKFCIFCRWTSMVNGGYALYARFVDPNLSAFQSITNEKYLMDARKEPLEVKWKFKWTVMQGQPKETEERTGFLTDLDAKIPPGSQTAGYFEFIAIDPPTWHLNKGDGDGSVWEGEVSTVIKDVIGQYAPGIEPDIGKSDDNKKNQWWMHRQDPKTFIMSLLDWSASVTKKQTQWVVASVDKKIVIKEQAELESDFFGEYAVNSSGNAAENVLKWHVLEQNYLSNLQTVLNTAGISAVSGLYCDQNNEPTKDKVQVRDDRTSNKKNVDIEADQGFSKPDNTDLGWTFVMGIPEDSAGLVGKKYQDYIDGRPRATFLNMLNMLMRMQITVAGNPKVHDSSKLGVSTVNLQWVDVDGAPFAFNGKWLVYGFEHYFTTDRQWYTNLYIARLDQDADAKKVG